MGRVLAFILIATMGGLKVKDEDDFHSERSLCSVENGLWEPGVEAGKQS
jgi:hypothetical protein